METVRKQAMNAAVALMGVMPKRRSQAARIGLEKRLRRAPGFTYIGLLILVALIGIGLSAVGQVWATMQQRDKEEELLFVGGQIRNALALYAANTPGNGERYPQRLDDLLKDSRYPGVRRYLRKIYRDPMTGSAEWGLVKTPTGTIAGVYSQSDRVPIKISQFNLADQSFEEKTKYSEWVFMPRARPGTAVMAPAPGTLPGQIQPNARK
jgi:type II secretory pathway pseudopilin PulG